MEWKLYEIIELCSFGLLHSGKLLLLTDVSGQPISPTFKTLEVGTDRLSQNIGE